MYGFHTYIGNVGKVESRGNLARETEHFGDNVTQNGQHTNTAVLQLGDAVRIKRFLVNVLGKSQGVCVYVSV